MRFLITAGGTREYIDPVRFISNASSGRMGYALARAALKAGHDVTLVTAPTGLKPPTGAKVIAVESAAQLFEAVKKQFPGCDCLIMAAAVSDFTPAHPASTKIKKDRGERLGGASPTLHLELKLTPDILRWAGRHKHVGWGLPHRKPPAKASETAAGQRPKILVGFALEDRNLRANAERKLREKNLDMIVANAPDSISAQRTTVHIKLRGTEWIQVGEAAKAAIATRIISLLTEHEAEFKR